MSMTFREAKAKIAEIVKGEYLSMKYELTVHTDGDTVPECHVFTCSDKDIVNETGGYGTGTYRTWEEVVKDLEDHFAGKPKAQHDPNQEPE